MKLSHFIRRSLLFAFALCSFFAVHGQPIAGAVPSGAVLSTPNINMLLPNGSDSVDIDLNCDMVNDLRVMLVFGDPAFDIPHVAGFTPLDTNLEFCSYTISGFPSPVLSLFDLGDTLTCPGASFWSGAPQLYLGYYGCVCPTGPEEEVDRYVHYRFGTQEGWIKVSFDINQVQTFITLNVPELAVWCTASAADDPDATSLMCYPNPSLDGWIGVETGLDIRTVTAFDSKGALVRKSELTSNKLQLPEQAGLYILEFEDEYGAVIRQKVIRR